jgi:hypothetical protein
MEERSPGVWCLRLYTRPSFDRQRDMARILAAELCDHNLQATHGMEPPGLTADLGLR